LPVAFFVRHLIEGRHERARVDAATEAVKIVLFIALDVYEEVAHSVRLK
jgi:hypothetical protein